MRLRCPTDCRHEFDLPDDIAGGARVRCPACGKLLIVPDRGEAGHVQAGFPSLSLDRETEVVPAKAPVNLERQIYDGVPPLSVMLALKRRGGGETDDDADLDIRHAMSDEDWTALAAFEELLHAAAGLQMATLYGVLAVIANLLVWSAAGETATREGGSAGLRWLSHLATLLMLGAGFYVMLSGSSLMRKLRLEPIVTFLPWSTLCVALLLLVNVALNLMPLFASRYPSAIDSWVVLSVPFNLIAAFDSARVSFMVRAALNKVRPPPILERLTEAMKYLTSPT